MNPDPSAEFSRLLSVQLPAWAAEEGQAFDQRSGGSADRVVIYGFGDLGGKVLRGLTTLGIKPVGIVDAGLAATTGQVDGVPCVALAEGAARWGREAVFVVAVFNQSGTRAFAHIRSQLEAAGVRRISYFLPLFWKYPETFLPHYSLDLPSKLLAQKEHLQQAFDLLSDERSREDFAFFVEAIVSPDPERTLPAAAPDQTYFPEDIVRLSDQETFIDCGAYDGDTLVKFHALTEGRYSLYVGVEPDPANFARLEARIDGLRAATRGELEAREVGVGRDRLTLAFNSEGTISSAIQAGGELSIQIETLESIIGDRVPTYVKMDIEGFELAALQGGEAILRRTLPRVAVCIYHVQDHPWALPLYLHELGPSYRLYVRRHREYLDDVICYAVPAESGD